MCSCRGFLNSVGWWLMSWFVSSEDSDDNDSSNKVCLLIFIRALWYGDSVSVDGQLRPTWLQFHILCNILTFDMVSLCCEFVTMLTFLSDSIVASTKPDRSSYTIHLQNSQYHPAIVSPWPRIYYPPHVPFTLCYSNQTIIITQSHSSILSTCFTSSLEPASYITQDSLSKLLILLSATFISTCWFNLLHTAITFHHFSLFHSELKTYLFRKSYPPP